MLPSVEVSRDIQLLLKMEITKIEFVKEPGLLTVWTDTFPNNGFNFSIDEIADEADLRLKLSARVNKFLEEQSKINAREQRFLSLKSLVGTKI